MFSYICSWPAREYSWSRARTGELCYSCCLFIGVGPSVSPSIFYVPLSVFLCVYNTGRAQLVLALGGRFRAIHSVFVSFVRSLVRSRRAIKILIKLLLSRCSFECIPWQLVESGKINRPSHSPPGLYAGRVGIKIFLRSLNIDGSALVVEWNLPKMCIRPDSFAVKQQIWWNTLPLVF